MYETADTLLLYEELAFQDVLPVLWRPLSGAERDLAGGLEDRNLRTLQAWDVMDEQAPLESSKSNETAHAAELQRLDLKLNLLLDLVGKLLAAGHPRPPHVPIRFNAIGASWRLQDKLPEAGAEGILEIHLHECLAEPLRLMSRVTNVAPDGQVKVKFVNLGEPLCQLIEKLAFRRHRRQVAGARQARRGPA